MRLISWDIGIGNLSYCTMDNEKIIKWDKIDILEDIRQKEHMCEGILKNGLSCSKKASVYDVKEEDRKYYCGMHGKNMLKIPKCELCCGINKNGKECKSKAVYYGDDYKYYCNKHSRDIDGKLNKYITVDNISFYERSKFLYEKLRIMDDILDVDIVLIENQPVYKNPIMKSIQMLLYSYYLMNDVKEIHLLNATQKMKVYDGPKIECNIKDTHERNKYLAKKYCAYFLRDDKDRLEYFNGYDKKDDLADTYLQGLYYIRNVKV